MQGRVASIAHARGIRGRFPRRPRSGGLRGTAAAAALVPSPTVTGPILRTRRPATHRTIIPGGDSARPRQSRVRRGRIFLSGTANVYNTPALTTATVLSSGHPYKSRVIVRRPTSAAKFNGTVLVEWVNVTSGYNNDVMFRASQDHLIRAGYAYVGVSAQRIGIHGPAGLIAWSPARYGPSMSPTTGRS